MSSLPQHCPSSRELDDLELLLSGAMAPRQGFDLAPGADAVVTLHLPEPLRGSAVVLVDPEGLPLATMAPDGSLTPLARAAFGPFRSLQLSPPEARAAHAGRSWVPVDDALTRLDLNRIADRGPVVLLALTGTGTPALPPVALVRATLAAARELPDAVVVSVPLADHPQAPAGAQAALRAAVVARYAGPDAVWPLPARTSEPTAADYPPAVAAVVAQARRSASEQGLVLFFTGLSGSGKSTLARALGDRILEQGRREVTSLDGDVVRRNLSAGLSFSKADRETNIRRIGWVAAEISRHGGLAICSPIAPFAETRERVRADVEAAGGRFFLVHVATPLAECEKRDRKGLYAKARAGEIPEFTGISSPYEEPEDADVRVDTTGRSIEDALADVIKALAADGALDLRTPVVTHRTAPAAAVFTPSAPPATSPAVAPSAPDLFAPAPAPSVGGQRRGRAEAPLAVAFVCTANICRSAFLELTSRHLAPSGIEFISAGTQAASGHPMDAAMAAQLEPGVSPDGFTSARISGELLQVADLVLCAEQEHVDAVLARHPQYFRKVFTLGQFAASVAGSPLRGRALLEHALGSRVPHRPEFNIDDPYRRSEATMRRTASQMNAFVRDAVVLLAE